MLSKLYVLSLAVLVFALGAGCGDTIKDPVDSDDTQSSDDGGDVEDSETPEIKVDVSACSTNPGTTCKDKIEAKDSLACVAGFDLGTNQAGNEDVGYDYIGLYAYNDGSEGSKMTPEINNEGVGNAVSIPSCSGEKNYALYFKAEGFVDWGAGVGMDWGGPPNSSCDVEGAQECLNIGLEDPKFALSDAEKAEVCMGENADKKLDCLKRGKIIKEVKDLSAYRGIGFWIMATEKNMAIAMKVTFPIPASVRFYGGETGCSDDDTPTNNDCFNDYFKIISLPAKANTWEYKEVLFSEIGWSKDWGLQLDTLGYEQKNFPAKESMGIKFQIDSPYNQETFDFTELYIDDITLLPNS